MTPLSNRSQAMLMFWSYPKQKLMSHFLKANLKFLDFATLFLLIETGLVEEFLYMLRRTYQPNFYHQKLRQDIFIELNFREKKWLLSGSYNPSKSNIISHLEHLRRSLDLYSANYDNLLLMGGF